MVRGIEVVTRVESPVVTSNPFPLSEMVYFPALDTRVVVSGDGRTTFEGEAAQPESVAAPREKSRTARRLPLRRRVEGDINSKRA